MPPGPTPLPEGMGPADGPARELRNQRFGEVIQYALMQLGAHQGNAVASVRQLADILGVSPTMVHRYRGGRTDFDRLRAATVAQLGRAAGLDPGSIHAWVEHGRDAAMEHHRQLSAEPVAFTPLDLVREMERMLAARSAEVITAKRLQLDLLRADLQQQRSESPRLFDRLVESLGLTPLLERLQEESVSELSEDEWQMLADLLEQDPAALQERYLV